MSNHKGMACFGPTPKSRVGTTPGRSFGHSSARDSRKRVAQAGSGYDSFESLDGVDLSSRYPELLNFYIEPPGCDIRLETMETLAMERLRFLRIIEKHSSMKKVQCTLGVLTIKQNAHFRLLSNFKQNKSNFRDKNN